MAPPKYGSFTRILHNNNIELPMVWGKIQTVVVVSTTASGYWTDAAAADDMCYRIFRDPRRRLSVSSLPAPHPISRVGPANAFRDRIRNKLHHIHAHKQAARVLYHYRCICPTPSRTIDNRAVDSAGCILYIREEEVPTHTYIYIILWYYNNNIFCRKKKNIKRKKNE